MEEDLTNEKLGKKFKNQFDLVNYAIKLADNMIKTGRAPRVSIGIENPALQVLAELEEGKDILEDIPKEVELEVEVDLIAFETTSKGSAGSRFSDRKKMRLV